MDAFCDCGVGFARTGRQSVYAISWRDTRRNMTIARGDIHLLLIQYPKANVHKLAVELEQFEQFHVNVFIDD